MRSDEVGAIGCIRGELWVNETGIDEVGIGDMRIDVAI